MSTVIAEVVSIRVFWRTHDEWGRIPYFKQEWWVEICDDRGGQTFQPLIPLCDNCIMGISDALVLVASRNGVCIDVDQVRTDTRNRTAVWTRNEWEAEQDDC